MKLAFTISRRGWLLLAVLMPLLLLFAWVALRSGPLAPVNVTVVQVEERAISPALFGIGTVEGSIWVVLRRDSGMNGDYDGEATFEKDTG